ncbi:MAG TPA: VOC family protein [Chthoniobacterales bacterium]|jgi:uncharacterized glyoxalase superfamily protein PhnB
MKTTNHPPLIAYLNVNDAAAAIAFYQTAFGASERYRLTNPADGKIAHAELDLNGSMIMLADEQPAFGKSPATLSGTSVKFSLMVEDADAAIDKAAAAGATTLMPATDMFYGYRAGCLRDPFGHEWMVQHDIQKLSDEEIQARWAAMGADGCCGGN